MTRWIDVPFTVDTPMFLGSASTPNGNRRCDPAVQLVPTLRGALRHWFRALTGSAYGANTADLAAAESAIFGRAADEQGSASPVLLRLRKQPHTMDEARPAWTRPTDRRERFGIVYLLGQGLWSHQRRALASPYVRPYTQADQGVIAFSGPPDHLEVVRLCLWALSAFGGLGARNRKGFGGVTFDLQTLPGNNPNHPSGWLEATKSAQAVTAKIADLRPRPRPFDSLPTYPCFTADTYTQATGETAPIVQLLQLGAQWPSWQAALGDLGQRWRCLRTVPNHHPTHPYKPTVETREWTRVVHRSQTEFGLGALGLPIVFQQGIKVELHATRQTAGEDGTTVDMRYPSPIRFRLRREGNRYAATILAMATTCVPAGTKLMLLKQGTKRSLSLPDALVIAEIADAMATLAHPAAWAPQVW